MIPPISIEATTYFRIHDDWVQLLRVGRQRSGSLELKLSFVVGFRLGFSAEIQAEVEGQVLIELEVQPSQVASMLFGSRTSSERDWPATRPHPSRRLLWRSPGS